METPWFFSLSAILSYICYCTCAWDHCSVACPSFGQVLAIGQMASHFTSRILWYTEEFVVDSMIVRSPAASQTKKHPPSTTLTESWFELFVLIHFVWFLRTFQLWSHLSKIYYCRSFVVVFFQMQLCKPKLWYNTLFVGFFSWSLCPGNSSKQAIMSNVFLIVLSQTLTGLYNLI